MKIGIISTGNELLRGVIADTNAAWMAAKLYERGFSVHQIVVVGDDVEELSAKLKGSFQQYDLVIIGGGLGPTDDDVTAISAARALNCSLVMNDEAANQVRAAFSRFGRPMDRINLKQAELPKVSVVLENKRGTAPGFALSTEQGRAVFLPGVSSELKPMFERYVLDELPALKASRHVAVFKCFGMGESNIQAALRPVTKAFPDISWSFRASFPEISVMLTSSDEATLMDARVETLSLIGEAVFAEEEMSLPAALGRALERERLTMATAESCTGGLIGHSITEVAGSSAYFLGGIVAYDNDIKVGALGVEKAMIEEQGAVSETVVRAMAQGVRQAFGADIGLATSGIAGPGGGTPDKPVGLVHMAVAHPGGVEHLQRTFSGLGRSRVKHASAWAVMWMALKAI